MKAAAGIRVIHEGSAQEPQFVRARESLSEADRVYFVGFGYDQTNLERLGPIPKQATVYGSAYGLEPSEREALEARLDFPIQLGLKDHGALDFFREFPPLDS